MAKLIQKFAAQDGTEFNTEAEADAHDAALQHAESIEGYISAAGLEKAQAGLLRKHLPQFISFLNDGVQPPKEVKKERKPRAKKAEVADAGAGE